MGDDENAGSAVVLEAGRGRRLVVPAIVVLALLGLGGAATRLNAQSVDRIEERAAELAAEAQAANQEEVASLQRDVERLAEEIASVRESQTVHAAALQRIIEQLGEIQRSLGRVEGRGR